MVLMKKTLHEKHDLYVTGHVSHTIMRNLAAMSMIVMRKEEGMISLQQASSGPYLRKLLEPTFVSSSLSLRRSGSELEVRCAKRIYDFCNEV